MLHHQVLCILLVWMGTAFGSFANSDVGYSSRAFNFVNDLQRSLSPKALILTPSSSGFNVSTQRWTPFGNPSIAVVVRVATTDDVASTVKLANKYDMPFLATNHKHGVSISMSKLQGGIQIDMSGLDGIHMNKNHSAAVLGGGVYTEQVISYLYNQGKMAGILSKTSTSPRRFADCFLYRSLR